MQSVTKNRIGVFGGTFNPIHLGHLIVAQTAMERFELGRIIFIPCASPPHKNGSGLAGGHHRLAMVQGAIEGDLRFEASDVELLRGGRSYTIDTVRAIGAKMPGVEICFVIGADTLAELHLWREIGTLLSLVRFVTLARPGTDIAALRAEPERLRLPAPWPERLLADVAEGRQVDISSSDIRYRLAEGMSIRYLVPQSVEMYIVEHNLYRQS
jgi:nicotinate-nucleotide adenylyltransferase